MLIKLIRPFIVKLVRDGIIMPIGLRKSDLHFC